MLLGGFYLGEWVSLASKKRRNLERKKNETPDPTDTVSLRCSFWLGEDLLGYFLGYLTEDRRRRRPTCKSWNTVLLERKVESPRIGDEWEIEQRRCAKCQET